MRLQKFLSHAGVASRRASEKLILEGNVAVNEKKVTKLGTKINPKIDIVTVNGKKIWINSKKIYIALNKPKGYISSLSDPQGRNTVIDLLRNVRERIYPVGRLDYDTEGLLILTNDGEFTYCLTHPKHSIKKVYLAEVEGIPNNTDLNQLKKGILLNDGITSPAEVFLLGTRNSRAFVQLTIHEGRNRQVRRMMQAISHPIINLKRIKIGCVELGDLQVGQYRFLTSSEVKNLQDLAKK